MSRLEIVTEVTGSVWKIIAAVGDRLAEGATVMIVESMKMEIPVLIEDESTLVEILVEEGEPVSEGQVVAIVEA
ncbi:MAG: acetyl-CoA carboxylase biotin carboxyl carrier protein subunit [Acidimicrobiia bacterium]|nr:acetyl-CoA carboxylase biotin carboxyl carrier protein subunit [Acidimicrobiia bacterium]